MNLLLDKEPQARSCPGSPPANTSNKTSFNRSNWSSRTTLQKPKNIKRIQKVIPRINSISSNEYVDPVKDFPNSQWDRIFKKYDTFLNKNIHKVVPRITLDHMNPEIQSTEILWIIGLKNRTFEKQTKNPDIMRTNFQEISVVTNAGANVSSRT
jgi:hypothetical protein